MTRQRWQMALMAAILRRAILMTTVGIGGTLSLDEEVSC
jgi:hypothetical protein